ncbi:MAG: TetR/AcrR family transcriptional regulator [Defluviitaleaceae bacterium]|nr:TetR/AcrR family transcriptional regulator [Defluviitaleaceae bacterium]MCL2240697.1 TetR/AcrR family transcriptional regulator [Defluviitaleaceae bacterium]
MPDIYTRYAKFFALEGEKRERIINAAMGEFLHGFAQAKTEDITRAAGISKGLLFHYFGTKENLYAFLIDTAIDTIQREFIDRIEPGQRDLIETVWRMSLLKQEVSRRYPAMFDFLTSTYLDTKHSMNPEQVAHLAKFTRMRDKVLADTVENCDKSLFRASVDPQKAMEIINWTLTGYAEAKTAEAKRMGLAAVGVDARENYDRYLNEFKEYMDIFRQCFYN